MYNKLDDDLPPLAFRINKNIQTDSTIPVDKINQYIFAYLIDNYLNLKPHIASLETYFCV